MLDSHLFPTLDHLREKYQIEEQGRDRGTDGEPPATQAGLDPVETEVFEHCNNYYSKLLGEYRRKQLAFDEIRKGSGVTPGQLDADADQACTEIRNTYSKQREELRTHAKEARNAIKELNRFKEENEISRPPDIPDSTKLSWGILGAILLLETLINGFFFGEQLGGRIFDGISQAVLISLGNVLVLGLLGKLVIGQIVHHLSLHRFTGWVGLLAVVLPLALAFNLGVAHYRDALPDDYPNTGAECYRTDDDGVSGPTEADQEAVCLLRTSTFTLSGFKSYLLLFIGLAMCAIAIWDWAFHMTDPYPGYGKRERERRKNEGWLDAAKDDATTELDAVHRDSVAHQNAAFEDPVARRQRLIAAYKDVSTLAEQIGNQRRDLEVSCSGAIQLYRGANIAARPEEFRMAIPSHWEQPWKATWDTPEPPPEEPDDRETAATAEAEKESAIQAKRDRIARLDACHREMMIDMRRAAKLHG